MPEENSQQIQAFIAQHPEAVVLPIPTSLSELTTVNDEFGLQVLPGDADMDGFYYTLLQKPESL